MSRLPRVRVPLLTLVYRFGLRTAADRRRWLARLACLRVCGLLYAPWNWQLEHLPGDLLLFPEFTTIGRVDEAKNNGLSDHYVNPGINVFYTIDVHRFRFLLEWLIDKPSQEIQRLQLGWRAGDTSYWLGRFHNPIGYWNTRYHHGAYMQTTIARPGVMVYETSGGALPMHLSGLYVEGLKEFDGTGFYYILGVGAGPNLTNKRLDAFDIFSPEGGHLPGATLRLAYQPVSFGPDEYGVSASYTDIPGRAIGADTIGQSIFGVFANWRSERFGLLGEGFVMYNELRGLDHPQPLVTSLYGQAEWRFLNDWTLYGRIEGTFNARNDAYFQHFNYFVRDRYLGGVRYELPYNMALKFEVSRDQIRDDAFGAVALQWSAVFP